MSWRTSSECLPPYARLKIREALNLFPFKIRARLGIFKEILSNLHGFLNREAIKRAYFRWSASTEEFGVLHCVKLPWRCAKIRGHVVGLQKLSETESAAEPKLKPFASGRT